MQTKETVWAFVLVESKVGTAENEMDEGKPVAVTARDSETYQKPTESNGQSPT
jgi:hypothetical protein